MMASERGRNGKGAAVYTAHMNVKLTPEQAAAIRESGQPNSTWIREAVEERLEREWAKTFGELTTDERRRAARQAARQLQAELTANAEAIGQVLADDGIME